MKKWQLVLVMSAVLVGISGCAAVDKFFGYDEATQEHRPEDGLSGAVGGVGALVGLPWIGTALGLIGTIYADVRRRKYLKAGKSMVPAIDLVLERLSEDKKLSKEEVVSLLTEWKRKLDVEKEINVIRGK